MIKKVDAFPSIVYLAPPDSLEDFKDLPVKGERPQGTRMVDRCRVTIVDGTIFVVVDSPEGFRILFREKVADYYKNTELDTHHAITVSGKIVAFGKDANCGCGSRLRSWSPFGNFLSATGDPDA